MVSYFIRKEKGEKEPRGGVVRERERVEEILELRIVWNSQDAFQLEDAEVWK